MVYKKDRNGSCKDGYLLQLFFSTCDRFLFGFYIEKKTRADSVPWFKAFHGDFSVTELFFFLVSACGFATAVVGLWRAGGKVP